MATVFLIMFIFLGYLTAFYQNQQEPQPRERDYFYVGAFFVYSIWIALGIRGILDLIKSVLKNSALIKPAYTGLMVLLIILVPVRMLSVNYFENDRSRNFVPWDYSYNILQSAAPNSIIFTNGDNDTFPLWYLQDVEGVRQDVRIANLSLLNTPWYIKQLKNDTPHGTAKVKMNLTDQQIEDIGPMQWKARTVTAQISPKTYSEFGITDTAITNKGMISWKMDPTINFGSIKAVRAQDIVAMDIIRANINERPIYFAVTTPNNSKIGLDNYLVMEGLTYRVVPRKNVNYYSSINSKIMWDELMDEPKGFSKTYMPGFKFRGLNDSTIFFDENHQRLTVNYRNAYLQLANYYLNGKKDSVKAVELLDTMEEKIPHKLIPMDYRLLYNIADFYLQAGDKDKYESYARDVEKEALNELENTGFVASGDYNPYVVLKQIYDYFGEYDKFVEILKKLKVSVPNDPSIDNLIKQYEKMAKKSTPEVPQQNK